MSFWVSGAIIGSSLISSYSSGKAAEAASESASRTAASQADAQLKSTWAQVDELQRQFDYAQAALASGRQLQYNAQNAFATMMGINGPATGQVVPANTSYPTVTSQADRVAGATGGQPDFGAEYNQRQKRITELEAELAGGWQGSGDDFKSENRMNRRRAAWESRLNAELNPLKHLNQTIENEWADQQYGAGNYVRGSDGRIQPFGANIQYQPTVDERGFYDPMADQTRMAGTDLQSDILYGNVMDRQLAGPTYGEDPFFQYAQDTGIAGETFQESPGYQFALEQGLQAVENKSSAGGNFGGRALKEAQRYGTGLASQEYYNWANLRGGDLARTDQAFMDYLNRKGVDVNRLDNATLNYLQRQQYDIGRRDVQLGNVMARIGGAAGIGADVQGTVAAAQGTGGQMANVYRNQGNTLGNIYGAEGAAKSAASTMKWEGINQAAQGGISNFLTYDALRQQPAWGRTPATAGVPTGVGNAYAGYA